MKQAKLEWVLSQVFNHKLVY